MTGTTTGGGTSGVGPRNLVLAAMIFAVSMTFIDQTIVSIAVPEIQRELGLTSTGVGTLLVTEMRSRVTASLVARGVPASQAATQAAKVAEDQGSSGTTASIPHFIRLDFAYATRSVLIGMGVVMAPATVVGLVGLRRGLQAEPTAVDLGARGPEQPEAATT